MSEQWEVLCPPGIDPVGPSSISDFATTTSMDAYDSTDAALDDIASYDAVIVRVADLDSEVIERADRLKVIAKHGTGLDNVDIEAASEREIIVCNTPGVNARSVAEHTIALLFGIERNLHTADRHVRSGGWDRGAYTGAELQDMTLGLMGYGSIAQETAAIARGIGLDIIIYDPHRDPNAVPDGVDRVKEFIELFERADAVSLHVPLTEETRNAISTEQLAALGEHGVLINTARGGIVDETALVAALETDTIRGAALDNFTDEPPSEDHPLFDQDNVLVTPHIGGVTRDALARMSRGAAANIRTVYEGEIPESTVNSEALGGEATQ